MLEGMVLLAFIRQPMTLPDGQRYFVLEIRSDDGTERNLFSRLRPDIFGRDGQPMFLGAELGPGSRVRVDDHGKTMRALQVVELRTTNPFASS
jgi:hypothetical protein